MCSSMQLSFLSSIFGIIAFIGLLLFFVGAIKHKKSAVIFGYLFKLICCFKNLGIEIYQYNFDENFFHYSYFEHYPITYFYQYLYDRLGDYTLVTFAFNVIADNVLPIIFWTILFIAAIKTIKKSSNKIISIPIEPKWSCQQ